MFYTYLFIIRYIATHNREEGAFILHNKIVAICGKPFKYLRFHLGNGEYVYHTEPPNHKIMLQNTNTIPLVLKSHRLVFHLFSTSTSIFTHEYRQSALPRCYNWFKCQQTWPILYTQNHTVLHSWILFLDHWYFFILKMENKTFKILVAYGNYLIMKCKSNWHKNQL